MLKNFILSTKGVIDKFFFGGQEKNINNNEPIEKYFKDLVVEDIMKHRGDISLMSINSSLNSIMSTILKGSEDFVLLCLDSNKDDILGYITLRELSSLIFTCKRDSVLDFDSDKYFLSDFLRNKSNTGLHKVLRVAENMDIFSLFKKMCTKNIDVAVVIDEFAGVAGCITLRDIYQLIGVNITQVKNNDISNLQVDNSGFILIGGNMKLETFYQYIKTTYKHRSLNILEIIEDQLEENDTLSGLLCSHLGRVPATGETFNIEEGYFIVIDSSPRKINTLKFAIEKIVTKIPTKLLQ